MMVKIKLGISALVFLVLLFSPMAFASYTICYQEQTNESSVGDGICGLNYTGSYFYNGSWTDVTYAFDGVWDATYAKPTDNGTMIFTYAKPTNATPLSYWRFGYGLGEAEVNFTIPSDCWNYNESYLNFSVEATYSDDAINMFCQKGENSWENIGLFKGIDYYLYNISISGDGVVREEAMYWLLSDTYPTDEWCYQEQANESIVGDGTCGLNYTGTYYQEDNGCYFTNSIYDAFDADWNTGVYCDGGASGYVNYSVPENAISDSLLQIRTGLGFYQNITMPDACWNTSMIQFSIFTVAGYSPAFFCWDYNSSGWTTMFNDASSTSSWIYEEAMYWAITTTTSTTTTTTSTTTTSSTTTTTTPTTTTTMATTTTIGTTTTTIPIDTTSAPYVEAVVILGLIMIIGFLFFAIATGVKN